MRIWSALVVAAWVWGSVGSAAAIPLATAPCGARATCERAAPQRRARALLDQLQALWSRARHAHATLRKLYAATLRNAQRAWALAKPGTSAWQAPRGMRASLASASVGANAPVPAKEIARVPPDEFYLQATVEYPAAWVAARRAVNVRWALFDQRHLPDAWSPLAVSEHAIYSDVGHRQPITSRHTRYTQRVSGLGLLPGRYFVAAEIVLRGARPRLAVVSLGAFVVQKPPARGVRVLLPHFPGWYYRSAAIKLGRSKAQVRGRSILLDTSIERRDLQARAKSAPLYLEVVAESGFRRVALYRAIHRLRRPRERLRLRLEHQLPSGPYQLRLTAYTMARTAKHGVRGVYDYQRLPITISVSAPSPTNAPRRTPGRLGWEIDRRLRNYLREQVAVSFQRQRLLLLQRAWRKSLADLAAAQSRPTTGPAAPTTGP